MEMINIFLLAKELEKKDDVKKQTVKYNNEKGEEKMVEFYDYFDHLKKYGFTWTNSLILYQVKILPDGKNLIKTFKHPYNLSLLAEEFSRIIKFIDQRRQNKQIDYMKSFSDHFKYNKKGTIVTEDVLTANFRETIRYKSYIKTNH